MFAGVAVAVALWLLFQMLGMGIGLASVDLDDAGSLRDVGIGTTAWTFAAPVLATFFGCLVAGRMAGTPGRGIGAIHGLVVWALTAILGTSSLVLVLSLLAGGGAVQLEPQQILPPDAAQQAVATGQILLAAGLSMLVSLIAAVLGGAAGVTGRTRRRDRDDNVTRTIETPVVPPAVIEPPPVVATPPAP